MGIEGKKPQDKYKTEADIVPFEDEDEVDFDNTRGNGMLEMTRGRK